jgi:putative tryptophan/tyrosine transport system substrate-binding protein
MSKKTIIVLLVGLALASVGLAEAQQPKKVPRIEFLASGSSNLSNRTAFQQGLRESGYVEGQNIIIEYRWAEGKLDRLPDLAEELVRLKVDVVVVGGSTATRAAKNVTKLIPIVITNVTDPVVLGFVASLARPGGNIAGLTNLAPELGGKRLELLKENVPSFPAWPSWVIQTVKPRF